MARSLLHQRAMIVSSWVVTLSRDPVARVVAQARLGAEPTLIVGERIGDRLAVVAESSSPAAGEAALAALAETPGIVRIDVVAIDFSLAEAPGEVAP